MSFPHSFHSLSRQPKTELQNLSYSITSVNESAYKSQTNSFWKIGNRKKALLLSLPRDRRKPFVWTVEWTIRVPREHWEWGTGHYIGRSARACLVRLYALEVRKSSKPALYCTACPLIARHMELLLLTLTCYSSVYTALQLDKQ